MAAEIIAVILEALTAFGTGIMTFILLAFNTLVYDSLLGLTDLATWALVFLGIGLVGGVIAKFSR